MISFQTKESVRNDGLANWSPNKNQPDKISNLDISVSNIKEEIFTNISLDTKGGQSLLGKRGLEEPNCKNKKKSQVKNSDKGKIDTCSRVFQREDNLSSFRAFLQTGKLKEASKALLRIKEEDDKRLNLTHYNSLIKALCDQGENQKAHRILAEIKKGEREACDPTIETYAILIQGYCKVRNLTKAGKLLDEMIRNGRTPNHVIYDMIIQSCPEQSQKEKAAFLERRDTSDLSPIANVSFYNLLIELYCDQQKIGLAEDLLQEIEKNSNPECRPNTETFLPIIKGYCFQERVEDAEQLFLKAKSDLGDRFQPDTMTYSTLMEGYWKQGRKNDARGIFDKISQKNLPIQPAAHILIHLIFQSDLEEAKKIYNNAELREDLRTRWTKSHLLLLKGFTNESALIGILDHFERNPSDDTVKIVPGKKVMPGKYFSFSNFLDFGVQNIYPNLQTEVHPNDKRILVVKKKALKFDEYQNLILMYAEKNLIDNAHYWLREMKTYQLSPSKEIHRALLNAYARNGKDKFSADYYEKLVLRAFQAQDISTHEEGDDWLKEMIEKNLVPSKTISLSCLKSHVRRYKEDFSKEKSWKALNNQLRTMKENHSLSSLANCTFFTDLCSVISYEDPNLFQEICSSIFSAEII